MSKTENAAVGAATPTTANANATLPAMQNRDLQLYYNTLSSPAASVFDGILRPGAENAIKTPELCARFGVNVRKLRDMALYERDHGGIVLYAPGGKGGYFRPSNNPDQRRAELWAYYRVTRARCLHGLASLAPVKRELEKLEGQIDFGDLTADLTEPRE